MGFRDKKKTPLDRSEKGKGGGKAPFVVDESVDRLRDEIHRRLGGGERVGVKLTRSRSQTKILITLKGNLEATEEKLQGIVKGLGK